MIKLAANLSKKVPMPGIDFSSQQFGAAMEIEVSDNADAREIADRLGQVYRLLEGTIDQQLRAATPQTLPPASDRRGFLGGGNGGNGGNNGFAGNGGNGSGNGNGRRNGHASAAQIKAIFAISKDRGMSRDELIQALRGEFNVERPDDLDVRQASDFIGKLQAYRRAGR